MHTRQKKTPSESVGAVSFDFKSMNQNEIKQAVLNCKPDDYTRYYWLRYISKELQQGSLKKPGTDVMDILMELLESKESHTLLHVCQVATLAVLRGFDTDSQLILKTMFELISVAPKDNVSRLLNSFVALLITEPTPPIHLVEKFINYLDTHFDKVRDQLITGEVIALDKPDEDEFPESSLIEKLNFWQMCIRLLPLEKFESYINEHLPNLLFLMSHPSERLKVKLSECLLSVVDISHRFGIDLPIQDIRDTLTNTEYDIWNNEKHQKAFERISRMIKSGETLVSVDLWESIPESMNIRTNKKGQVIVGYSDAVAIDFLKRYLGSTFQSVFAQPTNTIRSERSFSSLLAIISSHPALKNVSLETESIRAYESIFSSDRLFFW